MSCNNQSHKVGALLKSIADLLECEVPRKPRTVALVAKFSNGIVVKGVEMSTIMRIDQVLTLSPSFQDAKGNSNVVLGGVPAWSVSDEGLATLAVSEDGLTCVVTPTGALGTVQVNMTVDVDPDADTQEIVGTMDVEFKPGKAVFVALNAVVADNDPVVEPPPVDPPVTP